MLPKIIVIVGATSSGKTALGLSLAKEFNGEVVSADSRQVYTKMTIGTAKPDGVWKMVRGEKVFMVDGVPHYMMDIVDPGHEMSLAEYKDRAVAHIADIASRGKLPIVVGGTGLYVWSIVDNLSMPSVPPNKTLRRSLEEKPLEELLLLLKKVDPKSFEQVDRQNPRRVIRALEVAILTGESFAEQRSLAKPLFEALQIGLKRELPDLYARIDKAIDAQIENGLIKETQKLLKQKYGWNLPSMSSIGYKQIGAYLNETMTLEAAVESIKQDTHRYAKRQITWFKRDKRIQWVGPDEVKNVRSMVQKFVS